MGTTCSETDFQWQAELIVKRGRRMGFTDSDLDDAIQEISPHLSNFRYDSARSNGASLRTALISVIDRRLLAIRRREARYAKCLQRVREIQGFTTNADDVLREPSYRDTTALVLDVQMTLSRLPDRDRQICEDLSHGYSVQEIADRLGCDWHTVKRRINRIREQFTQWGLDGWLEDA